MPLRFSEADVAAFAAASGDRNPLHVDRDYARATPFGGPVVHGSLLVLAALGALPEGAVASVRSVDVAFGGAVLVGETVELEVRESPQGDAWQVRVVGRGRGLARVVARTSEGLRSDAAVPAPTRAMRDEPAQLAELPEAGLELAGAYAATAWEAGGVPPALVEGLAWASYVVGMEVPGLDGVFAAVKLTVREHGSGSGAYALRVAEADPRTAHLVLEGALERADGGRVEASIEAFARPSVPALDVAALRQRAAAPSGRAVVVVGGSRGLGAALALALAGAGHETHVLHSSRASVPDGLHGHRADAADGEAVAAVASAIETGGLPLHGIVLAASPPPLPMGLTPGSATEVADYVAAALRLATVPLGALLPLLERDGFVLFCSSSAVSAPPRDWPHYVAAKSALEGLAAWTAAANPGVRSVAARLPKMLTAMTNLPSMRVGAAAPEPVALRLAALLEPGAVQPGYTLLEEEFA